MDREPVAIASAIQAILAALVVLGWLTIDDTTVTTVSTIVAGLIWTALTWWSRRSVTPTPPA